MITFSHFSAVSVCLDRFKGCVSGIYLTVPRARTVLLLFLSKRYRTKSQSVRQFKLLLKICLNRQAFGKCLFKGFDFSLSYFVLSLHILYFLFITLEFPRFRPFFVFNLCTIIVKHLVTLVMNDPIGKKCIVIVKGALRRFGEDIFIKLGWRVSSGSEKMPLHFNEDPGFFF